MSSSKPIVAIFPTGNEVVRQGQPLPVASVYDVNSFTLAALVARHGGLPIRHAPVRDTVTAVVARRSRRRRSADVVVLCGGSSVGERDVVIDAVATRGEVLFHGIASSRASRRCSRASAGSWCSACRATRRRACRTRTSCWCRRCAPGRAAAARSAAGPASAGERGQLAARTGISSCRCGSTASWRGRPSRDPGEITSLSQADGYVEIPVGVARLDAGSTSRCP